MTIPPATHAVEVLADPGRNEELDVQNQVNPMARVNNDYFKTTNKKAPLF